MSSKLFGPSSREWNPLTLALLTALWIATAANWPLWRALFALPENASGRGALFVLGFAGLIAALTLLLLALAAWRRTIKPVAALLLVPAAAGAHFMGTYGVVIDPTMMTNVLQTNPTETRDLLSLRLLASLLVLAALPIAWMWRLRLRRLGPLAQGGRNLAAMIGALALGAALLFAIFADLSATMRNHKSLRYLINPHNSFYALGVLAHQANAKPAGPPLPIGQDATLAARPAGAKPPLVLLVIGETARADHFSLNGYERATNPQLAKLDVVSFRDVSSCGTNTAASVPCMVSHLGREAYVARERDQENLLDLAWRAGLAVLWLDNQAGCKGVCARVPNAMATEGAPAALCSDGECLDEALLHGLDARIAALPAERRARGLLLVMHQMGSHGPAYWRRSPPDGKPFQPECETNVLQQCERQALVNAYDNSIAYTDRVLAGAIGWLQQQRTAFEPLMLYVSDHGESLGENGLYLHGLPYAVAPREQTHVPMVVWTPSAERRQCLAAQRDAPLSHDNLFHTVAGALGIRASEYRAALDLFAACRAP
ncbi:MAG: phosphoethanolamine--lipid A transferase [Piscinibacter sp.]|uniref:phosphoethanolamine transferase n=1 Tax=Piscinibacter sp. TaxID=1903157 RepID=UPI001B652F22|nr:phosphoethanolamine--lipid A transferase [Piscinibacter sp.]MBP5990578.1 phosphoethanolamine--lipid A transferase [Piscinibacter sp.]MBP6028073.1 phosphoethanolamine--lipid A transferase [Piscinibacter sp.]